MSSDVKDLTKKTEEMISTPNPKQWQRYMELEPIKRLDNEGRELLGKEIYITIKRDGENVPIWLDETDQVHISSHNNEVADNDIQSRFKATPEYKKAVELLLDEKNQWHNDCILYGELLKLVSPTRIEPKRKRTHWILFDIYSKTEGKYMDYTLIYQKAYHFKIPIVGLLDVIAPKSLEELEEKIVGYKKWCKSHKKEGIVGKCYSDNIYFKEKIDLPKKPKLEKPQKSEIVYPPMPQDRIDRAIQHAIDQVGVDNWKIVKIAMPIVAVQLETEGREHFFNTPRNMYQIYLDTLVDEKYKHL
jgi:hypothetical protein